MIISSITSAAVASSVWANATRTLTTNVNAATAVGTLASVAAGVVLDLRPAAGKLREVCASPAGLANVLCGYYDGTTFTPCTPSAGFSDIWAGMCGPSFGLAVKNTAAGANNVAYSGIDWA